MHTAPLIFISLSLAIFAAVLLVSLFHVLRRGGSKSAGGKLSANLRDEKLKFEIIINTIEDGMVLIDKQGIVQIFNPGATTITGWEGNEAIGIDVRTVIKLVDEKNKASDDEKNPLIQVFKTNQVVRDNTAFLTTRAGKQIPVSLSVTPLLDNLQRATGAVIVFRNVTEERADEQRRGEFISTASHEMRTPVAAIEGYLALALNEKVATIDNRARGYLEKAHSSTQHLGQLFQDLLTSAKAEDGRLSSHPIVIEMGALLEQLTTDLRFAADKKGLYTEFTIGSNSIINASQGAPNEKIIKPLYYTLVDPDRLREVVTNLFDNAVKYTDQGKITIGLTGDNQVVQFYVRDTGPGIAAEDVPHLFQKFYRVDNSATRTIGGTGLGLFICRKIVELYNGRIWVESEPGNGSSFFINFPRLTTQQANEILTAAKGSLELQPISSLATS